MGKTNAHKIGGNCALHPLIHTMLEFTVAQDMGQGQGSVGEEKKRPQ